MRFTRPYTGYLTFSINRWKWETFISVETGPAHIHILPIILIGPSGCLTGDTAKIFSQRPSGIQLWFLNETGRGIKSKEDNTPEAFFKINLKKKN